MKKDGWDDGGAAFKFGDFYCPPYFRVSTNLSYLSFFIPPILIQNIFARQKKTFSTQRMALIFEKQLSPIGKIGLWRIEEPEAFFLEQLDLQEFERDELEKIKGHKRLEWLSSRLLLWLMQPDKPAGRMPIWKDEFNKPHFQTEEEEVAELSLSISHSRGMAAAIVAPSNVGIDIQQVVPKIHAIAHKFMREEEMACLQTGSETEHLHVFWGAKEALYKAYGRRELDFRKHILVEPFQLTFPKGSTMAIVEKDDYSSAFQVDYQQFEDYFLVWCCSGGF